VALSGVTTVDFGTSAGTNLNVYGDDIVTVTPRPGPGSSTSPSPAPARFRRLSPPVDSWAYLTAPVVSPSAGRPSSHPPVGAVGWGWRLSCLEQRRLHRSRYDYSRHPDQSRLRLLVTERPERLAGPATVTVTGGSQASPVTPLWRRLLRPSRRVRRCAGGHRDEWGYFVCQPGPQPG